MHDVGNIVVSPRAGQARSTHAQRARTQHHALPGYRILAGSRSEVLQTGASIAWAHHERWNGSGYPRRLKARRSRSRHGSPRSQTSSTASAASASIARDSRARKRCRSARRAAVATSVLTPREREVLQLASEGLSSAALADALVASPGTVKTHFQNIYAKLDAGNRASAVAIALRRGMLG
ncbi:MAG: cyclic di-GMP phosphodiesterase [Solirubrobacteraceae bacterium]|nr:cyclic di-GMP phosphodiesterase [Solirubrobacteraceae bacterium]